MTYIETGGLSPQTRVLFAASDYEGVVSVGGRGAGVLKRHFWDWYRELEGRGVIREWAGTEKETMTVPENNRREKALFEVFSAEMKRMGTRLSDEEIEAGWREYLESQ